MTTHTPHTIPQVIRQRSCCCPVTVERVYILLLFLSAGEEMDAEELLYNMESQTTPLLSPQSPSPLGPLPPVTGKAGKPKKPKKAPQVVRITLCEVLCSIWCFVK